MDSSAVSPGLLHTKLLTLVLMLCFSLLCGFSPVCVLRRVTRFSSDPGEEDEEDDEAHIEINESKL